MSEKITAIEHKLEQDRIMFIANMIMATDGLGDFVQRCEHSEAFGCFVDPTMWIQGIDKLQLIKTTAQAVFEAQGTIKKAFNAYLVKHPGEKPDGQ